MSTHWNVCPRLRFACLVLLAVVIALSSGACLSARGAAAVPNAPASATLDTPPSPAPALPDTPSAPTAAPPAQLEVLSYKVYPWGDSGTQVVGELQNQGAQPIAEAKVKIALLDSGGAELAAGEGGAYGISVPAGAKRPFSIEISNAPKDWQKVRIETSGRAPFPGETDQEYTDLRVDLLAVRQDETQGIVAGGKVTNTGAKPSQPPLIQITAYDEAAQVIDVINTGGQDSLAPGQETYFSVPLPHLAALPAGYAAAVVGFVAPEGFVPSAQVEVIASRFYPKPDSNQVDVVGEVQNHGPVPALSVQVSAAVLAADGAVLSIGNADVGHGLLPPGAAWPFVMNLSAPKGAYGEIRLHPGGHVPDTTSTSANYRAFAVDGLNAPAPDSWGKFGLLGRVTNTGEQAAEQVTVYGVERDGAGKIVDVATGRSTVAQLAPGASAPFDARFNHLLARPQNYEVFVDGWLAGGAQPVVSGQAAETPDQSGLPGQTPQPAAVPVSLHIASYVAYKDGAGRLEIFGEVANTGDVAARVVIATVTLLDADGKPIGMDEAGLGYLAAGERGTFVSLIQPPAGYKDFRVEVAGEPEPGGPPASRYTALAVVQSGSGKSTQMTNAWDVMGIVKNTGAEEAQNVVVYGMARDAAGRLTDLASAQTRVSVLEAGDQAPFGLRFRYTTAPPASIDFRVEGTLVTPHTPTPTPSPTSVPTSTPSPSPTLAAAGALQVLDHRQYVGPDGKWAFVGEVKNGGEYSAHNVTVALTLLDPSGQVAGAGAARVWRLIYPGDTEPFVLVMDPPKAEVKQIVFAVTGESDPMAGAADQIVNVRSSNRKLAQDPQSGRWVMSMTLTNTEDKAVEFTRVVLQARQKGDGPILDVAFGDPEQMALEPGDATGVTFTFQYLSEPPPNTLLSTYGKYVTPAEADAGSQAAAPGASSPAAVAGELVEEAQATSTPAPAANVRVEDVQPTSTPTPGTTATRPEVKLAIRSYRAYDKGATYVGEVGNVGDTTAESWGVVVTLLDAAGNPVGSARSVALGWALAPGERSPFWVSFWQYGYNSSRKLMPERWAGVRLQAQGEPRAGGGPSERYRALEVRQAAVSLDAAFNKYQVTGLVEDLGGRGAENIQVWATGFDAAGQVLDVALGTVEGGALAPGRSTPFRVVFQYAETAPVTFTIQAQGSAPQEPAGPAAAAGPTAAAPPAQVATTYTVVEGKGTPEVVGEVANLGAVEIAPQVLVTLLDAQGQIVATGRGATAASLVSGAKLPFTVHLTGVTPGSWKETRVEVTAAPAGDRYYDGVRAVEVTGHSDPAAFYLDGRLANAGDLTASAITVYGIAYDAAGKVIDTGLAFGPDSLKVGESAPLRLQFSRLQATQAVTWYLNVIATGDWMEALQLKPTPVGQSPAPVAQSAAPAQPAATARAPYPTPDSGAPVRVENFTVARRANTNAAWLYGEVVNDGAEPLKWATLALALLDDGGTAVSSQMGEVLGPIPAQGGRLPFALFLDAPSGADWKSVAVSAFGEPAQAGEYVPNAYRDFKVDHVNFLRTLDSVGNVVGYTVHGFVTNVGTKSALLTVHQIALYDADGRVADLQRLGLENRLAPGQQTTFELLLGGLDRPPQKYAVLVAGNAE